MTETDRKEPQSKDKPKNDQDYSALREVAPYLMLGTQLAIAVLAMFFLGSWLDTVFGTSPWLKLVGFFLGAIGGFIQFFRSVQYLTKQQESKNGDKKR
jgi:F0F1-type ATP synthase assembly protein I